jgi:hypothetical protein
MPSIVGGWQGNSFVLNAIPKKVNKRSPTRISRHDLYILYMEKFVPNGANRVSLVHLSTFQFHERRTAIATAKHLSKSFDKPIVLAVKHQVNNTERQLKRYRPCRKRKLLLGK